MKLQKYNLTLSHNDEKTNKKKKTLFAQMEPENTLNPTSHLKNQLNRDAEFCNLHNPSTFSNRFNINNPYTFYAPIKYQSSHHILCTNLIQALQIKK